MIKSQSTVIKHVHPNEPILKKSFLIYEFCHVLIEVTENFFSKDKQMQLIDLVQPKKNL